MDQKQGKGDTTMARTGNWSKLYVPNSPKYHKEKLEILHQKMEKLPVQAPMMSNSQLTSTPDVSYSEFRKEYKQKSLS